MCAFYILHQDCYMAQSLQQIQRMCPGIFTKKSPRECPGAANSIL
jgi:hypothetical protein